MKYTTKSIVNSKYKKENKSVSTLPALIETLCDEEKANKKEISEVLKSIESMKAKHRREAELALFLLETGCRISEALQIKCTDIDSLGRVKIRGKKGSKNRIVFSPSNVSNFLKARNYGFVIWEDFSRFYIYRVFKSYGLGAFFGGNQRMSITHYFRHLNAMIATEVTTDTSEVANLLGHKSQKSTDFYLKGKRL